MRLFVIGQTQYLSRHLRVGGVRALTDLGFAELHGHGAVEIELHPARRRFQRNREHRRVVPERRHADAAPHGAGLVGVFLALARVVDVRHALVKALIIRIRIQLIL